jgi:hypothetical protein
MHLFRDQTGSIFVCSHYYWRILKVHDFNLARLLTSKGLPDVCPFPKTREWKLNTDRAPEEEYKEDGQMTDRIDVLSLGSLFYTLLLTRKCPLHRCICEDQHWAKEYEEAIKYIVDRNETFLTTSIVKSEDPTSYVAIVDAMRWCQEYEAKDRPSSQQVD